MDTVVYLMGSRLSSLAEDLDARAANLANANTPGFKRMLGAFRVLSGPEAESLVEAVGSGIQPDWPELTAWQIDPSQGPIRQTGRPLDLAVRGPAFLVVETPEGERYTRKGRLYLDAGGELIDSSGNRFAADSGSLRIPEDAAHITVSGAGEVFADGESVGKLNLVDLPDPAALVAEGWGLYRNDGAPAREAVDSEVIQGAIEESNVNAVAEMVALVRVMRAYEAGARIAKQADSLNRQLIQSAA